MKTQFSERECCALFFAAALAVSDKLPVGEIMQRGFGYADAFLSEVKRRRKKKK
jgi:hypothetical protein